MLVELPLAVPVLLGGVRVAAVAAVGMATIAAAIGAKGLGTYIFRGISLADPRLILLGSVPAAILALACDAALGELERSLDPTRTRRRPGSATPSAWRWPARSLLGGVCGAWIDLAGGPSGVDGRHRLEGLGRAGHPRPHARRPGRGPHPAQGRPPAQPGRLPDLLQRPEARRARRLRRIHRDRPDRRSSSSRPRTTRPRSWGSSGPRWPRRGSRPSTRSGSRTPSRS